MSVPSETPDASVAVRVAVLGPVLVEGRDRALSPATGALSRALLVALALAPRATLSVPALVDALWPNEPPRQEKAALQTLVSRLRTASGDGVLESTPGGYRLAVDAAQLDLSLARELHAEARAALEQGDASAAERLASTALALWRGEPGADLGHEELASELADAAHALRCELTLVRAEALLAAGDARAAAELAGESASSGLVDERFVSVLMRALASDGRRNDALRAFAAVRDRLADELGSDPSSELAALNAQLLREEGAPRPARVRIGLRSSPNELIGRDGDVAALLEATGASRITTILGAGGLGKTRLAQAVAAASERTPAVIVVELASLRTDDDITLALATTLGIREARSTRLQLDEPLVRTDLRTKILVALGERETLLVVDNCEHLIDGAARWIADIVDSTSSVRVLATSRAPLEIPGERLYPLAPLSSVDGDGGPAVTLFVERARAARPGTVLPLDIVARLCERLDGLPLAIELAAARTRTMSVEEIERRLGNRFALLTQSPRTAPERHRTLLAVIDWSWNLLGEGERMLLRRLSRFPDGFNTDAAEAVAGAPDAPRGVTDELDALVSQSLVDVVENEETGLLRFRMLETVREFGELQLVAAGEEELVREAAFRWAAGFALDYLADELGPDQVEVFHRIDAEHDNLVTVFREALTAGRPDIVTPLFALLGFYWSMRGMHSEVVTFAPEVQESLRSYEPTGDAASAAITAHTIIAGTMLYGDLRTAVRAILQLRRLYALGVRARTPMFDAMAQLVMSVSRREEGMQLLERLRGSDQHSVSAFGHLISTQLAENEGDIEASLRYAERSFALAETAGDVWSRGTSGQILAQLHSQSGHPAETIEWSRVARRHLGALKAEGDIRQLDWLVGMAHVSLGDYETARTVFDVFVSVDESELGVDAIDLRGIGWAGLAEIAIGVGDRAEGLRLYDVALGVYDRSPLRSAPWYVIIGGAAICAHVFSPEPDHARVRRLARRIRTAVVVTHRMRPNFIDRPVLGSALIGIAAWLVLEADAASGAPRGELGRLAAEALALSARLAARQDVPSLRRDRLAAEFAELLGAEALENANARTAPLTREESVERAFTVLRHPAIVGLLWR
ncbi:ATP-binding protein [Compostimonas suwonensis]|uniref:ATP-binding protein n=1 Tax=Compostimonas suwonensis TaxID=1048394 RepID=UPI001473C866|nr:BTAD domain-containing putative transcriptional regulator [Compostimonas suwonensis]